MNLATLDTSIQIQIQTPPKYKRKEVHIWDWFFAHLLMLISLTLVALLASVAFFLANTAWPSIQRFGFGFLTQSTWDPVQGIFSVAPVIYGTLISSILAVVIATPLSIAAALFINELLPAKIATLFEFLIEMLAAIPSVVYGLWGIFVLTPWLRTSVEPFLGKYFGFIPLFSGPPYGVGMLAAGLILSIMITPTIFCIVKEVFQSIPIAHREAALALGATRWEVMKVAVLKSAWSGISGAVILGLGRALGETMAVTMVIGNQSDVSLSLFSPAQTMASIIANEYAEALGDIHLAALIEVGLVLFIVTFVINCLAQWAIIKPSARSLHS